MFQTLTGSLIILFAMVAIVFAFAVLITAVLRWIFGRDDETVAWSAMAAPARIASLRRAA
jgi:hypothetical protein